MKIILLLLVSLILYPFVGLGSEERTNPLNFYGYPSYIVLVHTSNPNVNSGDRFDAHLYISGSGSVDTSRVIISIPPYIVKPDSNKLTRMIYDPVIPGNNTFKPYPITEDIEPRFYILLSNKIYEQVLEGKLESGEEISYGVKFGERDNMFDGKSYSPYSFEFVIADNAPEGDHNIIINYVYKYQDRWYSDDQIVTIHVNRFYEKTWFYIMALIISTLSLIVLVSQVIKISGDVWEQIMNGS